MSEPNIPPNRLETTPMHGAAPQAHPSHPEFFRLPGPRQRDPYFGLSRAWYYSAERDGRLALVRLRQRGKLRGVTLIPFGAVAALIRGAVLRGKAGTSE